jgi:hypothetical protein
MDEWGSKKGRADFKLVGREVLLEKLGFQLFEQSGEPA